MAEEYTNFISVNAAQAAIPLKVIKEQTSIDPSLTAVRKAVESGDWTDKKANTNGVILRGTRIVIPADLQSRIVKLAHTYRTPRVSKD